MPRVTIGKVVPGHRSRRGAFGWASAAGLCLLASAGAWGGETLPQNARAYAYCTECHGSEATGNAVVGAPNLTVLSPWYLRRTLETYRAGRRGRHAEDLFGAEMQPIAAALPDEASIDAAIDYVRSFRPGRGRRTVTGDATRGAGLYAACAACHGSAGAGQATVGAPALAGQSDWYLVREIEAYRHGWRGADAANAADAAGAAMRSAALALPDQAAVEDVVAFIDSLPGPAAAPRLAAADPEPATARSAPGAVTPSGGAPPDAHGEAAVKRYALPGGSTFPIAEAVAVPAGARLLFHSGMTPQPANPKADPHTRDYLGDTKTQTLSVLGRLRDSLASMGYGLGDVVKMTVFLVGDPEKGGAMDFAGFMDAYKQFFGTAAQPNLPSRSAIQVARLANPMALVEIEVIAAK